jgi:hypothetical protein
VNILFANGVIFENEKGACIETVKKVSDKAFQILDAFIKENL